MTATRRRAGRRSVGPVRLTALGAAIVVVLLVILVRPPAGTDGQLASLVWAAVLGVFIVGTAWPIVAVRRIGVEIDAPRDLTVGDRSSLALRFAGPVSRFEVRVLDPPGPWHSATSPGHGTVDHVATRRGVFDVVRVELRSTAPLGVVAAHRVVDVELVRPTEVAPKPWRTGWHPDAVPLPGALSPNVAAPQAGDVVRAVRPYVSGDPAHLVHWPSSARTGGLVVKELEPPTPTGLAIVVDLRGDPLDAERVASYAAGAARSVLGAGGAVLLVTCEDRGPVVATVSSVLDAGRRLARAVPGAPSPAPEGWPVLELGT
jgi:uncharacterized protein (DUF58 family)